MSLKKEYDFDDLIIDESFQNWVINGKSDQENSFWNNWIKEHPDKKKDFNDAILLLKKFNGLVEATDNDKIDESWKRLKERIDNDFEKEISISRVPRQSIFQTNPWLKYAAAVVILLVSIFSIYNITKPETKWITYQSDFGQRKNIKLPDGTEVTLNAHSQLQIQTGAFNRSVKLLEGEAFFEVSKTTHKDPFVVHTGKFNIEVLGTEFNVNLRNDKGKVMLREGKVKLTLPNGSNTTMKPGQLATLDNAAFQISTVDPADFDAWLKNKVVFDVTSLSEIADFIGDHYGVQVVLDSTLNNRKLSGEIPNDNLELLLNALSITHDLSITHNGDTIIISE